MNGGMEPLGQSAAPPDEPLFQQARQELRSPKPVRIGSLVYIVLFLIFAAWNFSGLKSISGLALLVAVILFHEGGHALGMHLFGFRDVRMFFIPFFGAAVSGRSGGAAAWKEAVVSLLGPLPGLVLGIVLFFVMQHHPFPGAVAALQSLLLLNAFNLLPFGFLDGGRFLERVLFSRHRVLEIGFQALGSVLLGLVALGLGAPLLGLFALFSLTRLPVRWRTLGAAARLRRQHPTMPGNPGALADGEERAVFAAARELLPMPAREQPVVVARTMESILDGIKRAPGVLATLGLLALYGVGFITAAFGVFIVASETGSPSWQYVDQPAWRADFPKPPSYLHPKFGRDAGKDLWRAAVEGNERFAVIVSDGADGDGWMDSSVAEVAREGGSTLVGSHPADVGGRPGREFELSSPGRVLRVRMVAAGNRRYEVSASAWKWGGNQQRFLDSFALKPAP